MSNLVPVRRINKNGVSVLKHVRPENKSVDPALLRLPSPQAEPDAAAVRHRERWEAIRSVGAENPLTGNQQLMRVDKLATLGEETVSRFEELLELAPTTTDKHALTKMMGQFRPVQQIRARVNSFYAFKDLIGDDKKFEMNILSAAIDGLYPDDIMFEAIDYSKPSLYRMSRPKMEVIAALYRSSVPVGGSLDYEQLVLNDKGAIYACSGLQRVVMDHPDRIKDIVKLIVERKMKQKDMRDLHALISASPSSALMDGAL